MNSTGFGVLLHFRWIPANPVARSSGVQRYQDRSDAYQPVSVRGERLRKGGEQGMGDGGWYAYCVCICIGIGLRIGIRIA